MARAGGGPVTGWRLAWWTLIVNLGLAVLKIVGGIVFRSQAVLADGVHSLSDAAGSGAVLYGRRVAAEPPDEEHPYGHEKAESVAAFAVGVILLAAGMTVASDAIGRLLRGAPGTPALPALGIAVFGIGIKELFYRLNLRAAKSLGSSGFMASADDSRADVWSSAAALVGVVLGRFGVRWGDPAMALAVSALLVGSGAKVARDNLHELLEGRTSGLDETLRRAALSVLGVREVHDLRTRTMGSHVLVDLKIGVDGRMSVRDGHGVAQAVVTAVHVAAPAVREVLVHVNPAEAGRWLAEERERRAEGGAAE